MFDAFIRFANGIITHEASNHGGGGGSQMGYRGRAPDPPEEDEPPEDLRLTSDSLTISRAFWVSRALPADAVDLIDRLPEGSP